MTCLAFSQLLFCQFGISPGETISSLHMFTDEVNSKEENSFPMVIGIG